MISDRELLIKLERLKSILIDRARGGHPDYDEYVELRRELTSLPHIRDLLPRFVLSCRTVPEFWAFIQPKFATYKERTDYLQKEFEPLLNSLEFGETNLESTPITGDLFKHQFPAGLPFGLKKPSLAIVSRLGTQTTQFEDEPEIGVIRENAYPDLTFRHLADLLKDAPIGRSDLAHTLTSLIQTESEKKLFLKYATTFEMRSREVPVLVPQAWIQWHSKTKQDLRSEASSYASELYRVDFVAFWKYRRFAILVDDISHYAKKMSKGWDASESEYSKRLKEDRKLRKEGWHVFRVSNWEIRKEEFIPEILVDLQEFIGF